MPQAIPFIVYAGATLAQLSPLAIGAMTFVASAAVGQYQSDKAKESARRAYNRSLQDRYITVRGGTATRKYVVGTVRVGGTLLYGESILVPKAGWAKARSYLDTILAWSANECELVGYYLDDEYVAVGSFPPAKFDVKPSAQRHMGTITGASGSGTVTLGYTPDSGSVVAWVYTAEGVPPTSLTVTGISGSDVTFSGVPTGTNNVDISYTTSQDKLRQQFKSGSGSQTSTDWSGDPSAPRWTTNHRLRGVAYSRFASLWDEAAFQNGQPDITAVLKGGGADGHPFYDLRDASNPTYTDNPALLAAWWMTMPQALGGCGYPSDWIDWVAVGVAANICDELVTVKTLDGSSTESIKRYQCHTVLDTADAPLVNLDKILRSMAGRRAFTGGKYKIIAGAFRAATVTITDDDIVGTKPITIDATGGDVTPANIATGTFADATKKWQGTSPTVVRNSTYVTEDGAESTVDVDLSSVTDPRQANYLQGIAIELTRPCMRGSLSVKGIGENIALFDTVELDITNRSVYAGKTFEVTSLTDNWDGTFDLVLNEIRSTSYALDYTTWTPLVQPTPPDLSYLWDVDAVAGLSVSVGSPQKLLNGKSVSAVSLSWTAHTQDSVLATGRIEARYRRIGDSGYTSLGDVEGDATGTVFSAALTDGSTYEFQARARNSVGAVSQWSSVYATIIGSKAFVSHTMSITPDPGCENWDAWVLYGGTAPARAKLASLPFGGYAWYATARSDFYSKPVPIDRTKAYRATCWVDCSSGSQTGTCYLLCAFFDKDGVRIDGSTDGAGWPGAATFHYFGLLNAVPAAGASYEIAFGAGQTPVIPANAKFASIGVLAMYNSGTGAIYWQGRIQQLQETDLIAADAATELVHASVASQNVETTPTLFSQSFTPTVDAPVEISLTGGMSADLVNLGVGKGWCNMCMRLYEGTSSGTVLKTLYSRSINWTSGTNGTNQKGPIALNLTYDATGGQLYTVVVDTYGLDANHFDNPVCDDSDLRVTVVKR